MDVRRAVVALDGAVNALVSAFALGGGGPPLEIHLSPDNWRALRLMLDVAHGASPVLKVPTYPNGNGDWLDVIFYGGVQFVCSTSVPHRWQA